MPHTSNINAFILAATVKSPLVQAYCGLVAIELVLKHEVALVDHNVCAALNRFRTQRANSSSAFGLIALTSQLQAAIVAIQVNGKDGLPRAAPYDSFPYIRYSRFDTDGWGEPHTLTGTIESLANIVQRLRLFLRTHFGFQI
jgi:hypothetical protein